MWGHPCLHVLPFLAPHGRLSCKSASWSYWHHRPHPIPLVYFGWIKNKTKTKKHTNKTQIFDCIKCKNKCLEHTTLRECSNKINIIGSFALGAFLVAACIVVEDPAATKALAAFRVCRVMPWWRWSSGTTGTLAAAIASAAHESLLAAYPRNNSV